LAQIWRDGSWEIIFSLLSPSYKTNTVSRHHYFPTKVVRKSIIFKELQKCFWFHAKPCPQWRVPYNLAQIWRDGSWEIIFSLLSSSNKTNTVSRHHYFPTKIVRKSIIFKELQKCFWFHAKPCPQWWVPYKLAQIWRDGSWEIIFSLLSPSYKTNTVSRHHYFPTKTVR